MQDEKTVAVVDEDKLPADTNVFDGWDADEDEGDEPDEKAKADPPKAETKEKPQSAAVETKAETMAEEKPADQPVILKHLDEVKVVGKDIQMEEVYTLAQKGMDYDRQKQKNTELTAKYEELSKSVDQYSEAYQFLKELADEQALSIEELIDDTRATVLSQKREIDKAVALERVKSRRQETAKEKAATPKQEEKAPDKAPDKSAEELASERRQREIREFLTEYPAIDPATIPKEVWSDVAAGRNLLLAYKSWENKQLKSELEAEQKNKENKAKSTGSRSTAGNKTASKWLDGWED